LLNFKLLSFYQKISSSVLSMKTRYDELPLYPNPLPPNKLSLRMYVGNKDCALPWDRRLRRSPRSNRFESR